MQKNVYNIGYIFENLKYQDWSVIGNSTTSRRVLAKTHMANKVL